MCVDDDQNMLRGVVETMDRSCVHIHSTRLTTRLEKQRVPEADRLEEGGELVVAVLAPADDAQEEVHLGGGEEL